MLHSTRTILVAVILALWLPASVHCLFESAGWLSADLDCCPAEANEHGGDGSDGCGPCQTVEGGSYFRPAQLQVEGKEGLTLLPWPSPALAFVWLPDFPPSPIGSPPAAQAPWHFLQRAAASPRAPSA